MFNLKIGLYRFNKLSNKVSLVSIFVFEQTFHTFRVAETWVLPSITDFFVDISDYSLVRKDTSSQVAKHIVYIYIHVRRDIEFIMVDCQNIVCIRLALCLGASVSRVAKEKKSSTLTPLNHFRSFKAYPLHG